MLFIKIVNDIYRITGNFRGTKYSQMQERAFRQKKIRELLAPPVFNCNISNFAKEIFADEFSFA